ncbi:MAG TPA: hypothetical protein VM243_01280 [Phycisphaerae bacterium]|nr:hypothetical protein [Phycisphaerae bacterium]
MAVTLQIRDETTGGERTNERTLDLVTERITVRELIRSRVYQEVKDQNVKARQGNVFRGLVRPTDAEETLNGYRMRRPRELDWQKQFDVALEAFDKNGFLILVDNHQVERLDEEIRIDPTTQVTFLKLVPLVGG